MRQARLKAPENMEFAYYHCLSRVVEKRFAFGPTEKEEFVRLMRLYETYSGIRVVTYCVMSNHFHLLLEIPRKAPDFALSDQELLERLCPIVSPVSLGTTRQRLEMFREAGADAEAEAYKQAFLDRMQDVSAFMQVLKQRFTQWYNRLHQRKGTLWEERYKSVLVEAAGEALTAMAAYIDLNPVRAGLVEDPKEYRWCGYAEAVGGGAAARMGLAVAARTWRAQYGGTIETEREILESYRMLTYGRGEESGLNEERQPLRRGFTAEEIAEVMKRKGRLSYWQMLRCRVRYFSDGVALGSKAFVNEVFTRERQRFGTKRKDGARNLRFVEADGLKTLRDLRQQPIG